MPPAVTGGGTAGFHKEGAGQCCPHSWALPAPGSPSSADSSGLKSVLSPELSPGARKATCLTVTPTFLPTLEHSFLLIPRLLSRGLLSPRVYQGKSHEQDQSPSSRGCILGVCVGREGADKHTHEFVKSLLQRVLGTERGGSQDGRAAGQGLWVVWKEEPGKGISG